jgi:3-hydroxyacyl-[acyl-carrier-protein] dehydratase
MPGVLILEAMAQATGLLAFSDMGEARKTKLYLLVGIDKARFRDQVLPGDQLVLNIHLKRSMRGIGIFACEARVDGKIVADAEMMCSAQNRQ